MKGDLKRHFVNRNQYRRYLGVSTFLGGFLLVPISVWAVQLTIFSLLALTFILMGLYDLYASDFYRVIRPAGLITIGVGILLVALEVLQLWELIVLWPLAFILFGTISLLSGVLAEMHQQLPQT